MATGKMRIEFADGDLYRWIHNGAIFIRYGRDDGGPSEESIHACPIATTTTRRTSSTSRPGDEDNRTAYNFLFTITI